MVIYFLIPVIARRALARRSNLITMLEIASSPYGLLAITGVF